MCLMNMYLPSRINGTFALRVQAIKIERTPEKVFL